MILFLINQFEGIWSLELINGLIYGDLRLFIKYNNHMKDKEVDEKFNNKKEQDEHELGK